MLCLIFTRRSQIKRDRICEGYRHYPTSSSGKKDVVQGLSGGKQCLLPGVRGGLTDRHGFCRLCPAAGGFDRDYQTCLRRIFCWRSLRIDEIDQKSNRLTSSYLTFRRERLVEIVTSSWFGLVAVKAATSGSQRPASIANRRSEGLPPCPSWGNKPRIAH